MIFEEKRYFLVFFCSIKKRFFIHWAAFLAAAAAVSAMKTSMILRANIVLIFSWARQARKNSSWVTWKQLVRVQTQSIKLMLNWYIKSDKFYWRLVRPQKNVCLIKTTDVTCPSRSMSISLKAIVARSSPVVCSGLSLLFNRWNRSFTIRTISFWEIDPSPLMSNIRKICFKLASGDPLDMM